MKRKRRPEEFGRGVRAAAAGFSLLETVIVSLLVAALAVAALQSLAFALQARLRTQERWRASLQRWNRAAQSRAANAPEGPSFRPMPSARPIRVEWIEDAGAERRERWEVLRAEK